MTIIYLVRSMHETYGAYNEQGLKPLIEKSEGYLGKAFMTKDGAKNFIRSTLKLEAKWLENFIGRQPDVTKEETVETFSGGEPLWEAYVAWNLSEEDATKIKELYEEAVPGGAIEICMTYCGVELINE